MLCVHVDTVIIVVYSFVCLYWEIEIVHGFGRLRNVRSTQCVIIFIIFGSEKNAFPFLLHFLQLYPRLRCAEIDFVWWINYRLISIRFFIECENRTVNQDLFLIINLIPDFILFCWMRRRFMKEVCFLLHHKASLLYTPCHFMCLLLYEGGNFSIWRPSINDVRF